MDVAAMHSADKTNGVSLVSRMYIHACVSLMLGVTLLVYLISSLRRHLLVNLEDCLIKLICLSLWRCNDCVCIICFLFSLCWAYISG